MAELTTLLLRANAGDKAARSQLFATAYNELHAQARARLRTGGRNTFLDTTALLHESFLRFVRAGQLSLNDRSHFFAYASTVMHSVIVDFARRRNSARRGGGVEHVALDTDIGDRLAADEAEVIHVHEMLEQLAFDDPRLAKIVELRYFAGMSDAEIAALLGITDRTVRRDWKRARLLLSAAIA